MDTRKYFTQIEVSISFYDVILNSQFQMLIAAMWTVCVQQAMDARTQDNIMGGKYFSLDVRVFIFSHSNSFSNR